VATASQFDASRDVACGGLIVQLPFRFSEVVENLRADAGSRLKVSNPVPEQAQSSRLGR
jgi:hypothetical protein